MWVVGLGNGQALAVPAGVLLSSFEKPSIAAAGSMWHPGAAVARGSPACPIQHWAGLHLDSSLASVVSPCLCSIQALMSAPNPDDPLDEGVAKHWRSNEVEAMEVARQWTRQYAQA